MPKKNHENASYAGHEGVVTDARDNLHEVNPLKNLDGTPSDGLVVEPVEDVEEAVAPGIGGPLYPVEDVDDEDEGAEPDNETPVFDPKKPRRTSSAASAAGDKQRQGADGPADDKASTKSNR